MAFSVRGTLRRPLQAALALALALCATAACRSEPAPAPPPPVAERAWVQLSGRGVEARLITGARTCPVMKVDGKPLPMRQRAGPGPAFPVTVCQALLPPRAVRASIGAIPLALPHGPPQRILIFGDTGCRLKGAAVQKCANPPDDPRAWPFAEVSRLAAAHHPDLIIHVGDYYYRESPCPAGRSGCEGSPWGDNWATWDADFFAPATPLLAAAPWVMVRGNHESCARGGAGWFLLLDAGLAPRACPAIAAPYAVPIGGLNLYILDSADTNDTVAPADAVAAFGAQLDALRLPLATRPGWIITHRPFWGLAPVLRLGPIGPLEAPLNATQQAAARRRSLAAVRMVVSGHVHHFASFSFGARRPAQLIVGTGGDIGESGDTPRFRAQTVSLDGMTASNFGFGRYGFLLMERAGGAWQGAFYDLDDHVIARCRLIARNLTCGPATGP